MRICDSRMLGFLIFRSNEATKYTQISDQPYRGIRHSRWRLRMGRELLGQVVVHADAVCDGQHEHAAVHRVHLHRNYQ